ncbi:MAG: PilZ domain-containing protein [Phycisphaerae bacterium]
MATERGTTARGSCARGAEDRRRFNRLAVSLPFAELKTGEQELPEGVCTTDISPSGMMFVTEGAHVPRQGADVQFELVVPAGEGYSTCEGRIRGSGKVVRTQQLAEVGVGVGVQFTQPLSLKF